MTTQTPLQLLDSMIAPILVSANVARQARDALPVQVWQLVPASLRLPVDAMFSAVENYDRMIGRLKMAGLVEGVGTKTPQD